MKLTRISKLTGIVELQTGLHIGGGDAEMRIGGTDNTVVRNPLNNQPYIPGSSLKGKMRHLMEWRAGAVKVTNGSPLAYKHLSKMAESEQQAAQNILKLFGGAPQTDEDLHVIQEIGTTRLSFWDCSLNRKWLASIEDRLTQLPQYTEVKAENTINRIRGVAESPRHTERVPAGARFDFNLTIQVLDDEDLLPEVLTGLRLVELTGLGGSVSRGYGKVAFLDLVLDGTSVQAHYDRTLSAAA